MSESLLNTHTAIFDKDMACDMAYAEKPYLESASEMAKRGLHDDADFYRMEAKEAGLFAGRLFLIDKLNIIEVEQSRLQDLGYRLVGQKV